MDNRECSVCGVALSGRRTTYCSHRCASTGYRTGSTMAESVCEVCNNTFEHLAIPSSKPKYCSIQCAGIPKRKFHSRAWKRSVRKDHCEICGFIPVNMGQLDLDNADGNRFNNSVDNLQTLCANCHRLKTILNRDTARPSYDGDGGEL